MDKIKQNPKKILGVVAGVLFLAAILFMLMPGIKFDIDEGFKIYFSTSLFALAFGGDLIAKANVEGVAVQETCKIESNPMILVACIILILLIVVTIILICGLFTEKLNKKTLIILSVTVVVFAVVSAILIFASKESSLSKGFSAYITRVTGEKPSAEDLKDIIKEFKDMVKEGNGSYGLGAGAIVTPIMMLLGACSLTGVICLSAKEAK